MTDALCRSLFLTVLLGAVPACHAQEAAIALRVWNETSALPVPVGLSMPVAGDGGVFVRYSAPEGDDDAIHWISADGKTIRAFSFQRIPRSPARQKSSFEPADMTPLADGGLAVLGVWSRQEGDKVRAAEYSIESYRQDGSHADSLAVDGSQFVPIHLATLKSGFALLCGVSDDQGWREEHLILLDRAGRRIVTKLIEGASARAETAPVPAALKGGSGSNSGQGSTPGGSYGVNVAGAKLIPGQDGNAYLLPSDPGKDGFQIRSDGTMEPFRLDKPPLAEGEKAIVIDGLEAEGRLAVEFLILPQNAPTSGPVKMTRFDIGIYSVQAPGHALNHYVAQSTQASPMMVSAEGSTFSFLSFAPDPVTKVRRRTIVELAP